MGTSNLASKDKEKSSDFTEYLRSEYQNIAEAHFRTIEAISSFFRYYLIIMGVPFSLYAVIIGLSQQIGEIIYTLTALTGIVSIIIAVVGFFVTLYIVNLRLDVVLYARTVNGIRKYIYDNADVDLNIKIRMRTLPQTPTLPPYFEYYFLPVVLSFAVFDSVYLFIGTSIFSVPIPEIAKVNSLSAITGISASIPIWIWALSIFFLFFHIIAYRIVANQRELTYLKSYSIGVDIDGVLNNHREHFCKLLYKYTGKQLHPDTILKIPVHEDPSHGVTEADEKIVFDNPTYWTDMPSAHDAKSSMKKIRNSLKLEIHVFTYRSSPSANARRNKAIMRDWEEAALKAYKQSDFFIARVFRIMSVHKGFQKVFEKTIDKNLLFRMRLEKSERLGIRPIEILTRRWLETKGIEYDTLTIERGSEDASDPRGHFRNRFFISRKRKMKFFVEDDPEKAVKLSFICDIVFLMEQSYNISDTLPSNVVRVSNWDEAYRQIRKYS